MFFVINLSAQKFAKKNQYKKIDAVSINTNKEFKSYVSNLNFKMEGIHANLKQLEFFSKYQEGIKKKLNSKINSLKIEFTELTFDLNNFVQYGVGDWKLFRNEFNSDLALIDNDILALESEYEPRDLIVGK